MQILLKSFTEMFPTCKEALRKVQELAGCVKEQIQKAALIKNNTEYQFGYWSKVSIPTFAIYASNI